MLAVPPRSPTPWKAHTWAALLLSLSLATLLIHGFHPFAEDGGLYAAGIEYTLDPSLFPHFTAFVTEHLRFSLFAPFVALAVRATHLSLPAVLLLVDLLAAFFTMLAARAILRRCVAEERAQLAGLALLAAGWTLPVAGTSLFLMDPYITARSLVMPLSLYALACALDDWPPPPTPFHRHPALRCAAGLLLAAAFHPLMAAYAFLFVVALRATKAGNPRGHLSFRGTDNRQECHPERSEGSPHFLLSDDLRDRKAAVAAWILLALVVLLLCLVENALARPESGPENLAVLTRYYWFLSQWHWYERLGLLGPLIMLGLVLRARSAVLPPALQLLCRASILLGLLCTLCALLFAHQSAPSHMIARLQFLRAFLLLYAVMLLLLGATLCNACTQCASRSNGLRRSTLRALPALLTVSMATGLFAADRATFPASPHIEWPWRADRMPNPWVKAFLWARANTPRDALFALDARYVNTDGEDAQTFRAISLRSALPDYSKDGGEASITPALASTWLAGAEAQKDLSQLSDSQRDRRLAPFGVTWMVLRTPAQTSHACPYANSTVKVCRAPP